MSYFFACVQVIISPNSLRCVCEPLINFLPVEDVLVRQDDYRVIRLLFADRVIVGWLLISKLHCDRFFNVGDALSVANFLLQALELRDMVPR